MHPLAWQAMPEFPTVTCSESVIKGVDDHDIALFIHQPADRGDDPLPCVVHIHGGGMVLMTAADLSADQAKNLLQQHAQQLRPALLALGADLSQPSTAEPQ